MTKECYDELLAKVSRILIVNTSPKWCGKIERAMSIEMYKTYTNRFGISANHIWGKYTLIVDGKGENAPDIRSWDTMKDLFYERLVLKKDLCLGKVLILTHEQWLERVNPMWKKHYLADEKEVCDG